MSKVIFGFLGSLPQKKNNDNWKHWKKFFNMQHVNKNNIYILLHPFHINRDAYLEQYNNFKDEFKINEDNIQVVDENHHSKTEWGTNSLADATLLMMQYSLLKIKDIKKFVLLSPACCPIYNIDYIYNELTSNSKSWIFGNDLTKLNGKKVDSNFKFFKDDDYMNENGKYSLYFSNWMILDIKHINYFFLKNDPGSTYKKVDEIYKCKFEKPNERIILNVDFRDDPNYNKLNEFKEYFSKPFLDGTDLDGIKKDYCWPIEEIIFGNWVLKNIIDNGGDILSEINYTTVKAVGNILNTNSIFKKSLANNLKQFKNTNNLFNEIKSVSNNDVRGNSKKINNKIIPFGTEYDYIKNKNIRIISPTYVNWIKVSLDPRNIFRKFRLKEINFQPVNTKKTISDIVENITDLSWNTFEINNFLECKNPIMSLQVLVNNDKQLKEKKIKKLLNNEMAMTRSLTVLPLLPSTWHPLEYSSWSLKNMVNSFILMNFFKKVFLENKYIDLDIFNFKDAYELYRNILIENDIEIRKVVIDDVILEVPYIPSIKLDDPEYIIKYESNNYGTIVLPEDLLIARSIGCLFIRKCNDGSKINIYSDQLFEDPNINIKKNIGNVITKNLFNSGIDIKHYRKTNKEKHVIFKEELKYINEVLIKIFNQDQSNDKKGAINILLKFIMDKISMFKIFDISGTKYIKFGSPQNIVLELDENVLGQGAWNKVYKAKVIKSNNFKIDETLIVRSMYNNTNYVRRLGGENTFLSFYDNIIGIILTILQEKVLNIKVTNNVYYLGFDISTKMNEKIIGIGEPMYISSIQEKVEGDLLGYWERKEYSYDIYLSLFYRIVCKLDLLQKKLQFIHGDLKLDNVFYQKGTGDNIDILISDFGNSMLTFDGVRIKGNPNFNVYGADKNPPYYGKDILYFLISTLRDLQSKLSIETLSIELENECTNNPNCQYSKLGNIIKLIKIIYFGKELYERKTLDDIDDGDKFMYKNEKRTANPGAIFKLENEFTQFSTERVKEGILLENPDIKCDMPEYTNNNQKYYKKYLKYKKKYLNLQKNNKKNNKKNIK